MRACLRSKSIRRTAMQTRACRSRARARTTRRACGSRRHFALTRGHDGADHSLVPRRFTREEANAALETVRPLAEQMVAHRRALRELQERQRALVLRIASNGGDLAPSDVSDLAVEIEREADAMREC